MLTLRGIVYRERGLFADAESDLRAALAVDARNRRGARGAGDPLRRAAAPGGGGRATARRCRLAPKNPAYLNNLGFSLFLRQRFKQAIAEYEKAARLAPLSKRVRTNLGFAYAAAGDLRRAACGVPDGGPEAEAKNNLGFAYERRGDMSNAYDLYLEAVRLNPAAQKPRSNLVHAAEVLGRPVPADAAPPAPASSVDKKAEGPSESPPDEQREPKP